MQTILYALLLLLLLTGCNDPLAPPIPDVDHTSRYTLYTNVPPMVNPITRAGMADENKIVGGDFWIFVFNNTGTPADSSSIPLLEVAKAEPTTSTGPNFYKWTTTLKSYNHPVKVLIIANAPALVYGSDGAGAAAISPTYFPLNITFANALDKLFTVRLPSATDVVPYTPNATLPMSCVLNLPELTSQSNLGTESSPLQLSRVVAKITVVNSTPLTTNFLLKGANLHNAPSASCLIPRTILPNAPSTTKYEGTTPSQEVTHIAPATEPNPPIADVKESTTNNPLYCYEANALNTQALFLIIQANYQGTEGYYKITINRAVNGAAIQSIDRNMHYKLIINHCTASGYTTLSEAMAAPPSNFITYSMEVTDLSSHDILDNGNYFLAVTNSQCNIYQSGALANILPFSLNHNAPLSISSPRFVASSTEILSIAPAGGTLTPPFDVKIELSNSFTDGNIMIHLGNLSKTIPLIRQPSYTGAGGVLADFASDQYVSGEVIDPTATATWVRLSGSSTVNQKLTHISVDLGGIYLHIEENPTQEARTAVIYLARKNNEGRLKIILTQSVKAST